MITIDKINSELYKAYNLFNQRFFEAKLPPAAITIQSSIHHKLAMGWCTTKEIWSDKEGKNKLYEINISAEYIDYEFYETMDTLMHEMVHLYNKVHSIQDTSRNNTYHNKQFRERAIKSGFMYEENKPDPDYGWSFAKLSQETKDIINQMEIDQAIFTISRQGREHFEQIQEIDVSMNSIESALNDSRNSHAASTPSLTEEKKKRKSYYRWTCPNTNCDLIVRTTKLDVNIKCGICDKTLIVDE
ncbi:SprT-like domain-containing protein [Bacillus paranthracis]|uniref:SprT-like domain-containing protein n=1 Tax=Bacillus paranthracis TaxID=2026186 RepID=UPI003D65C37D